MNTFLAFLQNSVDFSDPHTPTPLPPAVGGRGGGGGGGGVSSCYFPAIKSPIPPLTPHRQRTFWGVPPGNKATTPPSLQVIVSPPSLLTSVVKILRNTPSDQVSRLYHRQGLSQKAFIAKASTVINWSTSCEGLLVPILGALSEGHYWLTSRYFFRLESMNCAIKKWTALYSDYVSYSQTYSSNKTLQDEAFSEKTSGLVESLRSLSPVEVLFTTKCSQSKHFARRWRLETHFTSTRKVCFDNTPQWEEL